MSKENNRIKVGITHGDINGIGYEVIIKTLFDSRVYEICTPIIYGSSKVMAYYRKVLNFNDFSFNTIRAVSEIVSGKVNVLNCVDDDIRVEFGKSTSFSAKESIPPLNLVIDHLIEKKIDVVVTAPIRKQDLKSDDFPYTGHTEFFQSMTDAEDALMLLVSENMKIGVATGHIPLSEVPETITKELIISKLKIMNNSLIRDFGIRKPRIAVLSLNPHSGDDGLFGKEEEEIIIPAIEESEKSGILAFGPYPSDGFFGASSYAKFDGILAMYHDQGLTPFKTMFFNTGVNYTAGLSIIRTSPCHGTAYEIAGKRVASEKSFRNAFNLACDIFNKRNEYNNINKNPLTPHNSSDELSKEDEGN